MPQPTSTQMLARAKVNLCLHVTGKRPDGYHLLDSLVVFPDIGDIVSVSDADQLSLKIEGPFFKGLSTVDNLVIDAAKSFESKRGAALKLTKNLPISSGIGGGSSDAAASLHLLAKHWHLAMPSAEKILFLGADVPVCMMGEPQRMQGIGEILTIVPNLPKFAIVLINSGVSIATRKVFETLDDKNNSPIERFENISNFPTLCKYLKRQRNDLQNPVIEMEPEISFVLKVLQTEPQCELARMSGSGATCFGLFETLPQAQKSAARIKTSHPDWWVKPAIV